MQPFTMAYKIELKSSLAPFLGFADYPSFKSPMASRMHYVRLSVSYIV